MYLHFSGFAGCDNKYFFFFVMIIYSEMVHHGSDDVVSFSSCINTSISTLYATMFSVARKGIVDRFFPVTLR
jgi:hypothetical protein